MKFGNTSRGKPASHRNQSTDLNYKSINWFLYDTSPRCRVRIDIRIGKTTNSRGKLFE